MMASKSVIIDDMLSAQKGIKIYLSPSSVRYINFDSKDTHTFTDWPLYQAFMEIKSVCQLHPFYAIVDSLNEDVENLAKVTGSALILMLYALSAIYVKKLPEMMRGIFG